MTKEEQIEKIKNDLRKVLENRSSELMAAIASNMVYSQTKPFVFSKDEEAINSFFKNELSAIEKTHGNEKTINSQIVFHNYAALKTLNKVGEPLNIENENFSLKNGKAILNETSTASLLCFKYKEKINDDKPVFHNSYMGSDPKVQSLENYFRNEYIKTEPFAQNYISGDKNCLKYVKNEDVKRIEQSGHSLGAEFANYTAREAKFNSWVPQDIELRVTTFGSPGNLSKTTIRHKSEDIGINEIKFKHDGDIVAELNGAKKHLINSKFGVENNNKKFIIQQNYYDGHIIPGEAKAGDKLMRQHSIAIMQMNKNSEIWMSVEPHIRDLTSLKVSNAKEIVLDVMNEFPVLSTYTKEYDNAQRIFNNFELVKNEKKEPEPVIWGEVIKKFDMSKISDKIDLLESNGNNMEPEKRKLPTPFGINRP